MRFLKALVLLNGQFESLALDSENFEQRLELRTQIFFFFCDKFVLFLNSIVPAFEFLTYSAVRMLFTLQLHG